MEKTDLCLDMLFFVYDFGYFYFFPGCVVVIISFSLQTDLKRVKKH